MIDLTLAQAARAVAERQITSRALVDACLERIVERDGDIKAFVRLAPDARDIAGQRDREKPRGPLHGVPIAIKDLIDTAGLGTEAGCRALKGRVPSRDAACVTAIKRAGAIIIGKTATTELAFSPPAATRNPRDPMRTPGGSSSGSAAAVADGMVPAALGTQTGGSVIRPAAFCGIHGFKSSVGRTDVAGVHELAGSMDTVGWMARSAEDLEILGQVLLTPRRETAALPTRPRIAWVRTPYDAKASAATHQALADCARRLAPYCDVVSRDLPPTFRDLNALHRRISSSESALAFQAYPAELLDPATNTYVAEGWANHATYARDMAEARAHRATLADFMRGFDALLAPAAPDEAPVGLASTGDAAFSLFWSLLHVPCATIPFATGPTDMPIGVQLIGAMDRDEELLALAAWIDVALRDARPLS